MTSTAPRYAHSRMIDNFSLGLTHGLLLLAAWRLIFRADLDSEPPPPRDETPAPRFGAKPPPAGGRVA